MPYHIAVKLLFSALIAAVVVGQLPAAPPAKPLLHQEWITSGDLVWRRAESEVPAPALRSRSLFTLSLIYCETGQHRDRLPRLLSLATAMQVRDRDDLSYGNFRWQWQHPGVLDPNAVEFCMRTATLLWSRHHEQLTPEVRQVMLELMRHSAAACERRLVEPAYTNIALMNASNLILLGQILDDERLSQEGRRRFEVIVDLAGDFGFMEYESPTYFGVTINVLQQLASYGEGERIKVSARALLELAWLQVAANWLPDAQRLAGSHSRSYDYLRGDGELRALLWAAGWVVEKPITVRYSVYAIAGATLLPAAAADVLASHRVDPALPRLIHQQIGPDPRQTRTTWISAGVALGSSGADYGTTDVPLAVDFRDARHARGYLTFDDRGDIFSEHPFARGGHVKAEHVRPFWTSVQRDQDAIGLVVFDADAAETLPYLATAFVVPATVDEAWLNGRRYELGEATLPPQVELPADTTLVLRSGRSAMGVRLFWTRNQQGSEGKLSLRRAGNLLGAAALVADLRGDERYGPAAAAVWVRVADELSDANFTDWREAFEQAKPLASAQWNTVRLTAPGVSEALELTAHAPWDERAVVRRNSVVARDPLLINLAPCSKPILHALPSSTAEALSPAQSAYWLVADQIRISPPLKLDPESRTISAAADLGVSAEIAGRASWQIKITEPGVYRLWAEGLAPTANANSFFLRLSPLDPLQFDHNAKEYWGVWSLPPTNEWGIRPVVLEASKHPGLYRLEKGEYQLSVFVREPGAGIRSWRLDRDLTWRP